MITQFLRWTSLIGLLMAGLAAECTGLAQADFQGASHLMPFEEEPIRYSKSPDTSPVARLQQRLERGEVTLERDGRWGYLLAVLRELNLNTNSQMLVFSKTSFQRERITPKTPRAVYFNDDVYLGFVVGAPVLEISTADPKLGGVFYTLNQTEEKARLVRNDQCLECHSSAKTMGVPGHLVRSFETDESGAVDLASGTSMVNHRTPFEERWGGWYVTGRHGNQAHRGNLFGKAAFARELKEPNHRGNQTDLTGFFDPSSYPAATSDIVALMVLEHQTHMHNFLTRLRYESSVALAQYGHIRYLKNVMEAFVKYLLFAEEAPLRAPVQGAPGFTRAFQQPGPQDRQGRSLRQFDLETRLFKYPCSYLIYSDAFDTLPEPVRAHVYQRLYDILTEKETGAEYERLSADSRRAILEILRETKKGLPDYWQKS